MAWRGSGVRIPSAPPRSKAGSPSRNRPFGSSGSSKRQQRSCEPVAELAERVTGGVRRGFGVGLHRDGDLAVPQDAHGYTRVHVERGQQRGTGLAGAVHGDPGNPRSNDAPVKAAVEVARLDRRAVPGGEDQTGVYPAISRTITINVLLLLADLKRSDAQIRQRQWCLGCLGLDLAADELVPDTLE